MSAMALSGRSPRSTAGSRADAARKSWVFSSARATSALLIQPVARASGRWMPAVPSLHRAAGDPLNGSSSVGGRSVASRAGGPVGRSDSAARGVALVPSPPSNQSAIPQGPTATTTTATAAARPSAAQPLPLRRRAGEYVRHPSGGPSGSSRSRCATIRARADGSSGAPAPRPRPPSGNAPTPRPVWTPRPCPTHRSRRACCARSLPRSERCTGHHHTARRHPAAGGRVTGRAPRSAVRP